MPSINAVFMCSFPQHGRLEIKIKPTAGHIKAMTFSPPSIATCLAHMILAGVTGWSLKYLPSSSHATGDASAPYIFVLLVFLLMHSLLGIFRFSHPEPHKNLRTLYELSALLALACPLPLLNAQLCIKYQFYGSQLVVHIFLLCSVLGPFLAGWLYSALSQRHKSYYVSTVAVVLNLGVLAWASFNNENVWGVGLVVSYGMKHFALPWLTDRYSVPFVDLYTYGLGFFEIFAVNVVIDADLYYRTELVVQ
ncbi:uncharacterized protein LOC129779209 isoform X2 [Toxorhynchites rutilus septentrionalis]|uniref:uncharacterized protein LOC129779209 isoform X2 n=1 Tax=Toxorhynchites rutilus septentrionalis TaxID=329112 RepID=UPI002478E352|nr:uncharacterized protein LOC129779209 isoform X2 [Toxorhynchites rutilus septentrionalis]